MKKIGLTMIVAWICCLILVGLRWNKNILPEYCEFVDKAIVMHIAIAVCVTILFCIEVLQKNNTRKIDP